MVEVKDSYRNGKVYDGTTIKFGISYNNNDYIVKLPKENMSVYTEFVASRFIESLGVSCHRVEMGAYKGQLVNLLLDFTMNKYELHSYKDTKQSSEDTDIGDKEYTYSDVLYMIDKHLKISEAEKEKAKEAFWTMFICDAILGNRDRHWGNWGYLSDGNRYKMAPIYDNGGSLFPDVYKVIDCYINNRTRKGFIKDRTYIFPASLLMIYDKEYGRARRTNYYDIMSDLRRFKLLGKKVSEVRGKFSYMDIYNRAYSIVNLDELSTLDVVYKRFYVEIITIRYMCIVLRYDFDKAYEIIEGLLNR